MEKKQFSAEYSFSVCLSILKAMFDRNIVTLEEYETARCELLNRFDAPLGALHSEIGKLSCRLSENQQ